MPRRGKSSNKHNWYAPILIVMCFLLLIGGLGIGFQSCKEREKPAAGLNEPGITNSVKQTVDSYRGKVIILDFWATWCPPCRAEIPDFIELQKAYGDQGLVVIGISVDPITRGVGKDQVASFMKSNGINYPIFIVNSQSSIEGYNISQGIPMTYVIGRDGKMVRSLLGQQSKMIFEQEIKKLL